MNIKPLIGSTLILAGLAIGLVGGAVDLLYHPLGQIITGVGRGIENLGCNLAEPDVMP